MPLRGIRHEPIRRCSRLRRCAPGFAPSEELHAAYYGKRGAPITFATYRERFLAEMLAVDGYLDELARRVARGEHITLLCSSACTDPAKCHRTLLIELLG